MKLQFYFILLSFIFKGLFLNAQTTESLEIPRLKMESFKFIGSSNGNVFFYSLTKVKKDLLITVYKYNETNMALVESKEVMINDVAPKVFNYNCEINASFKNNKFYFFYSLLHSGDFHIYLKTLDSNCNLIKDIELGVIVETGYELLGSYSVAYSPDNKTAILGLKNRCERKKAVGSNTEIYDNTELIDYDLINDKIIYSKRLPIEMDGLRFRTAGYKTDNDGNITFMASIADRKGGNTIKAIGIGSLGKTQEKVSISEIDVSKSESISSNFWQLRNGDMIVYATLSNDILFKYIPVDKLKKGFETKISKKTFTALEMYQTFAPVFTETDNGYFITYSHLTGSYQDDYSVVYINKAGQLVWHKKIELTKPLYSFYYYQRHHFNKVSVAYNNKLHVFCTENKPYETTEKTAKVLEKGNTIDRMNINDFQISEIAVDETGSMKKTVVQDCGAYQMAHDPEISSVNTNKDPAYIIFENKKFFKIKKVSFN